jgi:hypothetical protein
MESEEVKEEPQVKITLKNAIRNLKVISDFYDQNSNSEKIRNCISDIKNDLDDKYLNSRKK